MPAKSSSWGLVRFLVFWHALVLLLAMVLWIEIPRLVRNYLYQHWGATWYLIGGSGLVWWLTARLLHHAWLYRAGRRLSSRDRDWQPSFRNIREDL